MKYLGRAVRYLLKMVILIGVVMTILYFARQTKPQFWQILTQWQGIAFIAILVVWSFIYAKTGFVSYTIRMNMAAQHNKIVEAMEQGGYHLVGEELGIMRFRAKSLWTKFTLAGDDAITITAVGTEGIEVEGARSVVLKVELRLRRAAINEE